ncbi:cytochrome c-type biogenesis protein CcmH [Nitrosospira sp. Nsp5]|uniref:Cytochrome c-type biogenesis protein CcmH n=1 Tax=Nitrosospira multiformis TaxID=1231 RepID=A0ABY0TMN4_9PROT|nr:MULTISPECIES: c-type cytochrome biogenesis protein CcmI [Nitrosospira]PTR06082.1 cytochrome c-type biogenesis protein CcmH [Nitrosospira sp. Nsp5]SDQ85466.1 cytochrome c-type biogenesis protein CcmH [Nitrosospira multiformis]
MTSFWVVAGIFIVGALLFVLPTLLRKKDYQAGGGRDSTNISIYRDQLADLDNDLRSDILTREQYEQSKRELQQRMLEDVPQGGSVTTATLVGGGNRNVATIALVVLAIPLLAVSLYLWLGNTRALTPQPAVEQMPMQGMTDEGGHQNFSAVLDNLTARLKEQPDDMEGWVMLGRTYAMMQRFPEAKSAYEKALAMVPDDAELLTDYADIVAMTNNGSLMGQPQELINKALRLDPKNPKALALAGTAEFEQKRFKQAAVYWEQLLVLVPPESDLARSVSNSIAEAKSLASGKGSIMARAQDQAPGGQNPPPAGNRPESAAAAGAATAGGGTLSGNVTLSPAMAGKASPNDSLYIFARAKVGPRAPLATLRLQVKDLPATFSLNDSMARSGVQLSTFADEVVVGARISKSGSPMPQSGDLQGLSQPARVGDKGINVVIDQTLP